MHFIRGLLVHLSKVTRNVSIGISLCWSSRHSFSQQRSHSYWTTHCISIKCAILIVDTHCNVYTYTYKGVAVLYFICSLLCIFWSLSSYLCISGATTCDYWSTSLTRPAFWLWLKVWAKENVINDKQWDFK